ncbi:hypothetical protein FB45DRAFT_913766 [Roridomyces roridus]|uniref:Uncharacterized protein n=1 Tax=Roridomyces roridus TaxID=1738132 RepID=A0AAD7FQS5_9AGAR|nr:hypothetical protein FB45DRAFT_913766 [Roridomyces roridus]
MPGSGRTGRQRSTRQSAAVTGKGVGKHYTSPLKPRDTRKRGLLRPTGSAARASGLTQHLTALLNANPEPVTTPEMDEDVFMANDEAQAEDWEDWEDAGPPSAPPPPPPAAHVSPTLAKTKERQKHAWEYVLPLMEAPFAEYHRDTYRKPPPPVPATLEHICQGSSCRRVTATVQCLHTSYLQQIIVSTCDCVPIPVLLVHQQIGEILLMLADM